MKRMAVAALSLAGVFVALYLLLYKLGKIGQLSCRIGSCETVNTSKWATFLGAPVAAWGVAFYVLMFALAMCSVQDRFAGSRALSQVIAATATTGFVFSAWLTYLELFVIHAVCQWCVVSAVIATAIFVLAVADLRETASAARTQPA